MKNHTIGVLTNRLWRGKLCPIRVGRHVSSAGFPIPTSLASATRVALGLAQALHFHLRLKSDGMFRFSVDHSAIGASVSIRACCAMSREVAETPALRLAVSDSDALFMNKAIQRRSRSRADGGCNPGKRTSSWTK
jgi:hypothetical protein